MKGFIVTMVYGTSDIDYFEYVDTLWSYTGSEASRNADQQVQASTFGQLEVVKPNVNILTKRMFNLCSSY